MAHSGQTRPAKASAAKPSADTEMAKLSDALDRLAEVDPRLADCVDLKFFCGFSFMDIAAMRAVTERTVRRDWEKARILLHQLLDERPSG
jgi:DNA-directed RNA polymerase specialized sigma24 family protein